MPFKDFFNHILSTVQIEVQAIDIEGTEISIDDALKGINTISRLLSDMRNRFLELREIGINDEIMFFKEMKPQILSLLIYFNKIYSIELKRPNGSNDIQRNYYRKELDNLTYFFERNLDFYQYYRSNSTYLDEYYFVRGKTHSSICFDSFQFIQDPLFSTGFDYKVAKILANEMLKIHLNRKIQTIDRNPLIPNNSNKGAFFKWTSSKAAAVELGYGLYASGVINNGNTDIRDIMSMIENVFGIDLGDYYRTYLALKSRKKERTVFLKILMDNLARRMDEDDKI